MKQKPDEISAAPPARKMKFTPKIPPRKIPKPAAAKEEPSETKEDVINKELLSKINKAKTGEGSGRRIVKSEKKVAPTEVAFGYGNSTLARSFHKGRPKENQSEDDFNASASLLEKEYVEPWDYTHSYYPLTLPLRRPYSGNPEILDEEEFGEASTSAVLDEAQINPAEELGLMENKEEPQMIFFQFPANLPFMKQSAAAADNKDNGGKKVIGPIKGCKLEDLPAGLMGKIMVYKSGKVKMKLGDILYDISPGSKFVFAQDVAAINTREQHFCNLGELDKRAVVTPDVDSLLDSIDLDGL